MNADEGRTSAHSGPKGTVTRPFPSPNDSIDPCAIGSLAFHLNTGERWIVIRHRADGDLLILGESGDCTERWVHRDYWLGESWADR